MRRDEIERLLPGVVQRTVRHSPPLRTILHIMQALHAPSEAILHNLDNIFDANRTPDRFVPMLARWVDLEWIFDVSVDGGSTAEQLPEAPLSTGLGRLRQLVAQAAYVSQWRGTAAGLVRLLETATGETGFQIEERVLDDRGQVRPFHLRIRGLRSASEHRALIERIVRAEKPAYVTYELAFDL